MITYSFKLYNSKKNKKLYSLIDTAGLIYNHLIALHKRYYRMYKKHLNVYKLMKHITKLKRTKRFTYWNNLGSQAIQDIAERIDRGYKLFFRNRRNGIKSSPPSFKISSTFLHTSCSCPFKKSCPDDAVASELFRDGIQDAFESLCCFAKGIACNTTGKPALVFKTSPQDDVFYCRDGYIKFVIYMAMDHLHHPS